MPVQQDVKPKSEEAGGDPSSEPSELPLADDPTAPADPLARTADAETYDVAPVGSDSPTQLGTRRFVYAGYFAGALGIAFLVSKALEFGWLKLQSFKPVVGDPRDEILLPVSGLIGFGVALYYWRRTRARQLAEEVATEMSKVTWPSRTEVTNGTVVVILTTLVSTVFFALMDKFWGFVTNLVYGGT
jgi:preprotein translocase subunit SecE